MKAWQLSNPAPVEAGPLALVDLPMPKVNQGDLLIRVRACGVCHTDLHIVEGELPLPRLPLVPGHQIVGTVERVGPGVTRFRVGDRVGVPWLNYTDSSCEYCLRGQENLCDNARFTGYHVDGGYAQYQVTNEQFACPLPHLRDIPDEALAPLMCAGVVGYRALRLAGLLTGDHRVRRLGFYGFGASAHITIQVARHLEAEVYVFTRSAAHRQLAESLGAVWAGEAGNDPGVLMDASIIFAPAGELVPVALRALRKGGTLVLAGIHMSPIPQFDYQLIWEERVVRSVANATRRDAEELLALAPLVPIRTEVEVLPFEVANEALLRLKRSEVRGAAVLKIAGELREER